MTCGKASLENRHPYLCVLSPQSHARTRTINTQRCAREETNAGESGVHPCPGARLLIEPCVCRAKRVKRVTNLK
jgi:hypothetical protein